MDALVGIIEDRILTFIKCHSGKGLYRTPPAWTFYRQENLNQESEKQLSKITDLVKVLDQSWNQWLLTLFPVLIPVSFNTWVFLESTYGIPALEATSQTIHLVAPFYCWRNRGPVKEKVYDGHTAEPTWETHFPLRNLSGLAWALEEDLRSGWHWCVEECGCAL